MQTSLCPFCLKMVQTEICPYCGSDVNYPGYPNHLPVGFTLNGRNPYILGAARGQGGFGITYIAMDAVTGQRVAIKEYYPNHCCGRNNSTFVHPSYGQEETFVKGKQHFLQEAQMLQNLSDIESIVKVYDYFEANNSAYLVMEFLEGSSLKDYVEHNGKLPAQAFLQQLQPVMADMARMHQRGVIHRDIAPDNIILLPDGRMKLIDFGAARSYVGDKSMTVVVKKGFAPVEQYMRKGSSACTDVYALAATIYYCVTGVVPPDSAERQYGEAVMTAPSALGADLTPRQEYALERALALQPKDRIQSVAELTELLFAAESRPTGQQVIFEDTYHTVQENCPVMVESLKIVYDYDRNTALVQPVLRSLTNDSLQNVTAMLRCEAPDGSKLALAQFDIPCKNRKRNDTFGGEVPVQLPQGDIRGMYLAVVSVDYKDGTKVLCGVSCEAVAGRETLESCLGSNAEILQQYKMETTMEAAWKPVSGQYYWQCSCGCLNLATETVCSQCGTNKDVQLSALDPEKLAETIARRKEEAARIAAEEAKRREEEAQKRKEEARIRREKQKKILLKIVKGAAAAAAVAAVVVIGSWSVKYFKYSSANRALAGGDFEKAYESFTALDDFRDSREMALAAKYAQGDSLQKAEAYLDAALAFDAAAGYLDSAERSVYCKNEAAYQSAESLFDAGKYQEAAAAFTALGDHSDSAARAQESSYCYGVTLLDAGSYGDAFEVFGMLQGYKDSLERFNQAGYLYAGELSEAKQHHEAYLVYFQIADYKDSRALGQKEEYQYALDCVEEKLYAEGIEAFARLKGYKDAAAKLQETQYAYADALMESSQYQQASELYKELKDYKKSEEKYREARYQFACQLMDDGEYIAAVQEFSALDEYSNSAENLLEAKYLYADSHLEETDTVTAQYLDDLKAIPYKDAAVLYNRLFGWKVTLTAVNTDQADLETMVDSVPKDTDYLHFMFLLEGGKPDETVDLVYRIVWPGGLQKSGKSEWKNAADGFYLDCCWDHGIYEDLEKAKTGTMKVQVYTRQTGEFVGEGAVLITE